MRKRENKERRGHMTDTRVCTARQIDEVVQYIDTSPRVYVSIYDGEGNRLGFYLAECALPVGVRDTEAVDIVVTAKDLIKKAPVAEQQQERQPKSKERCLSGFWQRIRDLFL